jgi:hypothetical protein
MSATGVGEPPQAQQFQAAGGSRLVSTYASLVGCSPCVVALTRCNWSGGPCGTIFGVWSLPDLLSCLNVSSGQVHRMRPMLGMSLKILPRNESVVFNGQ